MGVLIFLKWGVGVDEKLQNMIEGIGNSGKWKTIATQGNREMRYDINSLIHKSWNKLPLVKFKSEICKKTKQRRRLVNTDMALVYLIS